jgi:GT2 family glycosyltransferase
VAIVLNWCGEEDTAACVASLKSSTHEHLTVLLVDNASPDGSGARLHARFPNVPFLQTGSNLGYTGGNNAGIRWALEQQADFILVINNDATVDPHCIATLVRVAEARPDAAVVAPQIMYFDAPEKIWFGGGVFSRMRALGLHREPRNGGRTGATHEPITFFTGCCFLARADAMAATGGFDDSFFAYVEDAELSLRLVRSGYSLLYVPAARAYHRVPLTAAPTAPYQIRLRDRNRRRLVSRHYGLGDRLRFAAWFYPSRLLHAARYALTGNLERLRAQLDGAFGALDTDDRAPVGVGSESQTN